MAQISVKDGVSLETALRFPVDGFHRVIAVVCVGVSRGSHGHHLHDDGQQADEGRVGVAPAAGVGSGAVRQYTDKDTTTNILILYE